jgi:predicted RNA-binding protein
MCQTNAFAVSGGGEEMLMEAVARLEVDGDTLRMRGIFGDRLEVKGRIVEINFQAGKMMVEKVE